MTKAKKGFAFYSTETDRYQDMKIKRLKKQFSCSGIAVWDYILNEIYRVEGCFTVWDENNAFDVADYFGIKESLVNEVVKFCCTVGLFNKEMLANENVLTSKAIQERYIKICKQARRNVINVPEEYRVITEENAKLPEVKPILPEDFPIVKKSRVKESKGNNSKSVFDDFKIQISSNEHQLYRETFYMNYKLKKGSLSKILDLFNNHLVLSSKTYESLKDYKNHFLNWVNVQDSSEKLGDFKIKRRKTI